MQKLLQLVRSLDTSEVRLVRSYYKRYSEHWAHQRLALFNLLLSGEALTDKSAAIALYDRSPDNGFRVLKSRLKQDLLRLLLHHAATANYSTNPIVSSRIECWRLILSGRILFAKGAALVAKEVLAKAKRITKKYELLAEGILIDMTLSEYHRFRTRPESMESRFDEIDQQIETLAYLNRSQRLRDQTMSKAIKSADKTSFVELADANLYEMKRLFEESSSAQVGNNYYRVLINKLSEERAYDELEETVLKYMELVAANPAIQSVNTEAGVLIILANANSMRANFGRSSDLAQEAVDLFPKGSRNELSALNVLFLNLFYQKEFKKAQAVLEKAKKHKAFNSDAFTPARWMYYEANLQFVRGNLTDCADLLNRNSVLTKDRTGWLLGFRILELMLLVENKEYDQIYYKLDNMRILLHHIKDASIARAKAIYQILRTLNKFNLSYTKTIVKENELIDRLFNDQHPQYLEWLPEGYELIRFDEWILERSR